MLWRWIGCVFGLVLIITGGSIFTVHLTATDNHNCLVFSGPLHNTGMLDVRTGAALNVTSVPQRLQQLSMQGSIDPQLVNYTADQHHVAYEAKDAKTDRFRLFVKSAAHP